MVNDSISVMDPELIAWAREGSCAAFDELVSRHHREIYQLAYRMMGNREDAADVRQEAFIRAWRSLKRFNGQCAFSTWLNRITINLCLTRKSRKNPVDQSVPFEEDRLPAQPTKGFGSMESIELRLATQQVLAALPARYRALLVLREIEGRSYQEMSEILESPIDTIRTQLARARKMLLKELQPLIEGEPL